MFEIDSFKFNKHRYEDNELVMRSPLCYPPSQLDLPKLVLCTVDRLISSTFVYLYSAILESTSSFTL